MLNFLFPKECLVCFKTGSWLCNRCQKKLLPTLPNCYICKTLSNNYKTHESCRRDNSLNQVITLWKYNEYSKKLMHNFKYKNRFQVGDFIFFLFEEKLKRLNLENSLLIPLPSHKTKTLERGFNPTEIMANLIGQKLKLKVKNDVILKTQKNTSQASLQYTQRVENVKGIFEINKEKMNILRNFNQIIIIDDIITTGATIKEVAREVRNVDSDVEINALCIFQGSFRNEHKKFLQPSIEKEKKI